MSENQKLGLGVNVDHFATIRQARLVTHPDPVNTNHSMIDMKTVRQYKAEQARILEQFNTPYYSLLVNLYWIENYIVGIWSREYV